MLSFESLTSASALLAVAGLAAASVFSAPIPARAAQADQLLEYLPHDSRFAGHVDVEALRGTKYLDRAVEFIEKRAKRDPAVPEVLGDAGAFDLRSDLDGFAVALPVSRISPGRSVDRAAVAFDTEFDESRLRALLEKRAVELSVRERDDGTKVYESGDRAFAVPSSDRLVVALGPSEYRKEVLELIGSDGATFADSARDEGLLDGVDRSRPVWMVNRIDRPGSSAETAAVAVELSGGIDLQVALRSNSESSAKSIVKRAEAMKKSRLRTAQLSMFGAAPLLENLAIEREGRMVKATTSMTDSELDYLVQRLREVSEGRSKLSIPAAEGGESAEDEESSHEASPEKSEDEEQSEGASE